MIKELTVERAWSTLKNNQFLFQIEDKYYMAPYRPNKGIDILKNAREIPEKTVKNHSNISEFMDYEYIMYGLEKRSGYNVKLGRAITEQEWEELKQRLQLSDDDISEPFSDVKGDIYGEKYRKEFTSVQIAVEIQDALSLERKLRDKGIEATNGSVGRLNIRIK